MCALAKVGDVKMRCLQNGGTIDYYEANITSAQGYHTFGMLMPGHNGHKWRVTGQTAAAK